MRLQQKVALVTGGTSGIGQRTVELFREHGANVVFTGRRTDLGNKVAKATGATFIEADAGNSDDAERSVKQTLDAHGRLDVLMNNAGGLQRPVVSRTCHWKVLMRPSGCMCAEAWRI